MDRLQQLSLQRKGMERLVDADRGAILLCLDISDPAGMARLLADPVKSPRAWSMFGAPVTPPPAPGSARRAENHDR